MNISTRPVRLLALILVATLAVTLAAPARAEALEPLVIVAIGSLVVVGVILVVFLIVANMSDSRRAAPGELRYVACAEPADCSALLEAHALAPSARLTQGQ